MQVTLKNIKHARSQSEETNAFTADVYVNNVRAGYAKNSGKGEQTHVSPLAAGEESRRLIREAEEFYRKLPPKKIEMYGESFDIPRSLHGEVDELIDRDLVGA